MLKVWNLWKGYKRAFFTTENIDLWSSVVRPYADITIKIQNVEQKALHWLRRSEDDNLKVNMECSQAEVSMIESCIRCFTGRKNLKLQSSI